MSPTESWTIALTAATLAVTVITVVFVVLNEIRSRRQYRRVDFYFDHLGSHDGGFELFDVTNCGTETATRISMVYTGCLPASSLDFRSIVVLSPGQTKRIVVKPVEPLEDCWVLINFFAVSDNRYIRYIWEPFLLNGRAGDRWMADMEAAGNRRLRDKLDYYRGVVKPVGPGHALGTRVQLGNHEKALANGNTASAIGRKWLASQQSAGPQTEEPERA